MYGQHYGNTQIAMLDGTFDFKKRYKFFKDSFGGTKKQYKKLTKKIDNNIQKNPIFKEFKDDYLKKNKHQIKDVEYYEEIFLQNIIHYGYMVFIIKIYPC